MITALHLADSLYNSLAVGHKHIHDVHCLGKQSAAIPAKVDDQSFHALLLQIDKSTAEIA